MCPVIHITSYRYSKSVTVRHIFCINQDKATCEICRIFRRSTFDYYDIVQLGRWDDIERKCTCICFAAGYCAIVYPYIIITLRQSSNHHELAIYNADTWYTADNFRCVLVLCPCDLLSGNARLYDQSFPLLGQ